MKKNRHDTMMMKKNSTRERELEKEREKVEREKERKIERGQCLGGH